MKILLILSLFVIGLSGTAGTGPKDFLETKELPARLDKNSFDRYFLDALTIADLKKNFGMPHSFIAGTEQDKMTILEATFYTKYGKIKFGFESGVVKRYEVLAVDDSFISPMK
jgi:hypothetical protein